VAGVTTQREIADRLGLPIHPPKAELFDIEAGTNTDSTQRVRKVEEYRVEPFGLYMGRAMGDHRTASYIESWLLPDLGIRVTDWMFKPGIQRDQDFYVDIVDIQRSPTAWRTVDYYLDILVRTGVDAKVIDVDEFLVALRADLMDDETAERAMQTTYRTLDGVARNGYDLPRWLAAQGIELTWRKRPGRESQ
jgi:predicted RNA-binding protein associated with RNAse of E/G family